MSNGTNVGLFAVLCPKLNQSTWY